MKKKINRHSGPVFAVLTDWFRGQYQQELIAGIEYEAKRQGAEVLYFAGRGLHSPEAYDAHQNTVYDLIPLSSINGLVVTGLLANRCTDREMCSFLNKFAGLPIITIDYRAEGIPGLFLDNKQGFRKLLEHLLNNHHCRKPAFIRGTGGNFDALQRFELFREMLDTHKIPFDEKYVVEGDYSYTAGKKAVKILIEERQLHPGMEMDAIVASNDLIALGAIDELHALGFNVPGDIAITGFDDLSDARDSIPPLTTIRQPAFAIGKQAVQALLDYSNTPHEISFHTECIIRNSCGCTGLSDESKETAAADFLPRDHLGARQIRPYRYNRISEFYIYQLIYVSDALKQVMNIGELARWIHEGFTSLNIQECYLFLYGQSGRPGPPYTLAAGYNRNGIISAGGTLSTITSVLDFLAPSGQSTSYCLLPLLFRDESFGFLIMDVNLKAWIAYETIRSQVSGSLKNIFMLEEIREVNKKLTDANAHLRRSDEEKNLFFINVAHETRTPLTLVRNYLEKYIQSHAPDRELAVINENLEILTRNMLRFLNLGQFEKIAGFTHSLHTPHSDKQTPRRLPAECEISPDKPSVFIVDDNFSMLQFLQDSLKGLYSVYLAADVNSALLKLERISGPEVIISDIMMDGTDGHEFLKRVSAHPRFAGVPFIFLTARHTENERLKGLAGGAVDYIEKPFSIKELMQKIAALINLRKRMSRKEAMKIRKRLTVFLSGEDTQEPTTRQELFVSLCLQYRITDREKDVLTFILKGKLNKEIACILNLTQRTVEYHITNIYRKFGINDRFRLMELFSPE